MSKYRVFDLIYRQGENKKLKAQFELNNMTDNIGKIRTREEDLTFNIKETVEVGVSQSGPSVKLKSKLREMMIHPTEVVEHKIDFLPIEQLHLQEMMTKHEFKNKKILDKLSELKSNDQKATELKQFERDILLRRK